MSSPPAPSANVPPPSRDTENEVDVDADMEDVTQDTTTSGGGTAQDPTQSSSTLHNEQNNTHQTSSISATDSTQTQTQSQTQQQSSTNTTTGNLPHNRKDVTLREFLSKMDDYAPIIPDAVTAHYLTLAGLPPPSAHDPSGATTNTTPLPLARLLALATQKFVADVAADAYQYSRIRAGNTTAGGGALGAAMPGQMGVPGASGAGGAGGGGGGAKGAQATQLGIQRAGFGGGGQGGSAQGKTVLTMEDLGMAVQEYGVNVKRGEFYR